jgi:CheY-like chemotaxis protein
MDAEYGQSSLGTLIRRRRVALGLSQEALAARASDDHDEVRQADISRLELGKVGLPRRARWLRLAAALDLAPGALLARSGWFGADEALAGDVVAIDAAPRRLIVVVDDEPIVAEALATLLAAEGYAVQHARRPADLLAQLLTDPPRLVIADAGWPAAAMTQLHERLRAESPPIPLLFVGDPPPSSVLDNIPAFARPLVLAELLAAVAAALEDDVHQAEELPEIERFP